VIVSFVEIGEIDDHHYLNVLFIIIHTVRIVIVYMCLYMKYRSLYYYS